MWCLLVLTPLVSKKRGVHRRNCCGRNAVRLHERLAYQSALLLSPPAYDPSSGRRLICLVYQDKWLLIGSGETEAAECEVVRGDNPLSEPIL